MRELALCMLPRKLILITHQRFFIRSKVEPHEYWYCNTPNGEIEPGNQVYTSRMERTAFCVNIANEQMPQGAVMISTDEIIISPMIAPELQLEIKEKLMILTVKGAGNESRSLKLTDVRDKFISGPQAMVYNYLGDSHNPVLVNSLVEVAGAGKYGNWELI